MFNRLSSGSLRELYSEPWKPFIRKYEMFLPGGLEGSCLKVWKASERKLKWLMRTTCKPYYLILDSFCPKAIWKLKRCLTKSMKGFRPESWKISTRRLKSFCQEAWKASALELRLEGLPTETLKGFCQDAWKASAWKHERLQLEILNVSTKKLERFLHQYSGISEKCTN